MAHTQDNETRSATSSAGAGDGESALSRDTVERCLTAAVLGLAVGDAVGTTVEFKPRGSFEPVEDMVGGGPFMLDKGQWTDDTSMALCMLVSLAELKTFDPKDMMTRFQKWANEGYLSSNGRCFDIGRATSCALRAYTPGTSPYCGDPDPKNAGNGSLMRLAPVPLCFWKFPRLAHRIAGMTSIITHAAPACIDACRYFAGLLIGALRGESKDTILSPKYSPVPGFWDDNQLEEHILSIAMGEYKEKEAEQISGAGWVVSTLEAVLWAFYRTDNFRDGLLLVVNLGDDADTTGAIYGQIAGCYYGRRGDGGIPEEWLDSVTMRDKMTQWCKEVATWSMTLESEVELQRMLDAIPQESDMNDRKPVAAASSVPANSRATRPGKTCVLL